MTRLLLGLVLVVTAFAAAPSTALAATPDLTLVTEARYDVRPEDRLVHVTVGIRATNHRRDTVIRRYYYDKAYLAVQPGTTNFRISSSGAKPSVKVAAKKKTHTLLLVNFGRRVYSGKSADLRLTFDLPDPGGAPTRQLRIGESLVSFPVWAFASESTPGSSVSVVFPADYEVRVESGDLGEPRTEPDGSIVLESGRLAAPLAFSAYVVGERPGALAERRMTVTALDQQIDLVLRSWEDDAPWAERVADVLERGLPELATRIGLPVDHEGPLIVEEAVSRSAGGYAGLFDPAASRIEIAYYADSFVVLHEAAHAWFNGRLLGDRWLNEAFASYYALAVADGLGIEARGQELTDELEAARIPLNAWAADESGDDPRTADATTDPDAPTADDAGYAAALALARTIAERAGEDGLSRVWAAAARRETGYERAPALGTAPDWRTVLDLLEAHTDARYDDLWRDWVVRPAEASLLEERSEASRDLEATAIAAGDWRLPRAIDRAMAAWQFDQARGLLAGAREVLALRTRVEAESAALGLRPPGALRGAFEGEGGSAAAIAEAEAEIATLQAIARAEETADAPVRGDAIERLGLVGQEPTADLEAARAAFEAGDLETAVARAEAAHSTWLGAGEIGRNRLLAGVAGLLVLFAAILLVTSRLRRPRPERLDREKGAAPVG